MRPTARFAATMVAPLIALICVTSPVHAQSISISCNDFASARERLQKVYRTHSVPIASADLADGIDLAPANPHRLDRVLLETALVSYDRHHCRTNRERGYGAAQIIIVDFAKPSSQPRLYALDLRTGQGIDSPILVAHGIGSDPDDNGIADRFGNGYNSLMSSLGAARGAEQYYGQNGLSLRLDGLDFSNSQMRRRDIVAHSYAPERRRYFNASLIAVRGKPGVSEGCFVVAPEYRDWLFGILRDGGFLYAGLGGDRAKEMPVNAPRTEAIIGDVVFVRGTGE